MDDLGTPTKLDDLAPAPRNPRIIDKAAATGLAHALGRFGDIAGITFNRRTKRLVCGHQRVDQLRKMGATLHTDAQGPYLAAGGNHFRVRVVDWTEAEELAANVTANNPHIAGTFTDELQSCLAELDDALGQSFETLQLDKLLADAKTSAEDDIEEGEVEPPSEPLAKPGDVWLLGEHRLYCGDSSQVKPRPCSLVVTSPPYDQQRDYGEHSTHTDWLAMMREVFGALNCAEDAQLLVNLGITHKDNEWSLYWLPWLDFMKDAGWRRFGLYVWDQGSGLPGNWSGRLAPSFELVFHFNKKSVMPEKWADCSSSGRTRNVYMRNKDGSMTAPKKSTTGDTKVPDSVIRVIRQAGGVGVGHPAPFSVGFAEHLIKTWPGDVLDPFGGSGSTLIACEKLGRASQIVEVEPAYCDLIIERWQNYTGGKAQREGA